MLRSFSHPSFKSDVESRRAVRRPGNRAAAGFFSNPQRSRLLILTRKLREAIVIGDGVTVKVLAIEGKRVRLGIEAPSGTPIRRGEIEERDEQPAAKQADVA